MGEASQVVKISARFCPDCGSPFPKEVSLMGLCPECLLSMALEDDESETLHGEVAGGILGERYQIREVLGRGGMGEVYRAFDLKLRVDVALKAVRAELSSSERARELLRQEVRSAREVVSPNVCRIYDPRWWRRVGSWCRWSTSDIRSRSECVTSTMSRALLAFLVLAPSASIQGA
jgi:hypothetical protein